MEELLKEILKKLEGMDGRLESMEQRLDSLETEVKGVRMEMETGFQNVYKRLDALEKTSTILKYDMDLFFDKQSEIERKVNKVEKIQDKLF